MDLTEFYNKAYSRNRGLIDEEQQQLLKNTRVAIPGMGGMGGLHSAVLARTGIGGYSIADFDEFDVHNMNRQFGCLASTVGKPKVTVMEEKINDINPSADVRVFNVAIGPGNVDEFLKDVDVVIDALDIFAMDARQLIYRRAKAKGIPVLFSAPVGFASTMFLFSPTGMDFDAFYGTTDEMSNNEKVIYFLAGIAGVGPHLRYMDVKNIDPATGGAPSLGLACQAAAGMVTTEVVNLILGLRAIKAVPKFVHYDPYARYYKTHHRWWGARNPMQRLRMKMLRKLVPALDQ